MKIAIVTENGKTISQHFGRATQYVVVNTEGGKILGREIRPKAGHMDFAATEQHEHECSCERHGYEPGASDKHGAMARNILDCSVLLVGGMGWGAYESLKSQNISPVITDVEDIDQAVALCIQGTLSNLMEKLH